MYNVIIFNSYEYMITYYFYIIYQQGEFQNKRPIFSLSPLKEGIFSIDFNSSLSPLQAFSICISYVESCKMTQHTQLKTHSPQLVPRIYTPIPRIKRSVMGKVTSL
ncbi:putative tubby-like protein [Helianthus annuus]|nr:putative tubby-like protein [Helianthus annuus]